jgi:hypothetical protein
MRIGSWARESTATTGTGTITLSGAITGRTALGDSLSDGEVFPYVIEDGNNREAGIGTYTVSGTTVARTEVRENLISGTYDNTSPSAITLSGSAEVYIGETPSSTLSPFNKYTPINTTIKEIQNPTIARASNSNRSFIVARQWLVEWPVFGVMELASLGVEILTIATTGSTARIGIYQKNALTNIWELLDQTAQITTNGTTGKKTAALSAGTLTLNPGFYGISIGSDSDVVLQGKSNYEPIFFPVKDYNTQTRGYFVNSAYSGGNLSSTLSVDHNSIDTILPLLWGVGV